MTREEAIQEVNKAFEPAFANYIITALTEGSTVSDGCEDCISRQAALDMATTIQTDDYSGNEVLEVVDVDDIKALPSVTPAIKWTPVSESFPKEHICDDGYVEPSETVLVQLNNGEMKTSRYWGSRESRKDEPWIDLSYPTTLEVVAWRPLPNKYSTPHDSRCGN